MTNLHFDSWELAPYFETNSLEEEVSFGDAKERKSLPDWQSRIAVNKCPLLVKATVTFLKSKHANLRSGPAVTRYATRAGIQVLQQIPEIGEIAKRYREAYLRGNELELMGYSGHNYDFGKRLSQNRVYLQCWAYKWVAGAISDIADELGLPTSMVGLIALIAGFAQSTEWIPEKHRRRFIKEIECFWKPYLKKRLDDTNSGITT